MLKKLEINFKIMFLVWLCLWSSINDQYCHTLYYYNICVYTSRKDKQFIIRCLYSTSIGEMYCIIHCTRLMYLSIDILPPVLIKTKVQLDLGFFKSLDSAHLNKGVYWKKGAAQRNWFSGYGNKSPGRCFNWRRKK